MELKKLNNDSKADIALQIESLKNEGEYFRAVVKVHRKGYVPKGFKVRSWLDDFMFTAELGKDAAKAIESDDQIESVSLSKKIQLLKKKGDG